MGALVLSEPFPRKRESMGSGRANGGVSPALPLLDSEAAGTRDKVGHRRVNPKLKCPL